MITLGATRSPIDDIRYIRIPAVEAPDIKSLTIYIGTVMTSPVFLELPHIQSQNGYHWIFIRIS